MKKDVGLQWNGVSNLVLRDMEKNEVLSTFVATVFYWQDLPSLSDMLGERSRGKGDKLPQGEVQLKWREKNHNSSGQTVESRCPKQLGNTH